MVICISLDVAANMTREEYIHHMFGNIFSNTSSTLCKTLGAITQGYVRAGKITRRAISIGGKNNSIMQSFSIISRDNKDKQKKKES